MFKLTRADPQMASFQLTREDVNQHVKGMKLPVNIVTDEFMEKLKVNIEMGLEYWMQEQTLEVSLQSIIRAAINFTLKS
jgi:hypothetical protein